MNKEIRLITAVIMLICAFGSLLLFQDSFKSITLGILIGAFSGLMGFNMIVNMSKRIDGDTLDVKNGAMKSYTRRYLLYTVIFALAALEGVHLLALLVGMLCHKSAILVYTFIHRKEDD